MVQPPVSSLSSKQNCQPLTLNTPWHDIALEGQGICHHPLWRLLFPHAVAADLHLQ